MLYSKAFPILNEMPLAEFREQYPHCLSIPIVLDTVCHDLKSFALKPCFTYVNIYHKAVGIIVRPRFQKVECHFQTTCIDPHVVL